MEEALTALARGRMHQPLRMIVRPEGAGGLLALMPAYRRGEPPTYGLKAVCVFHENPTRGLDAHQGCVMLFSGETGELLAVMNASAITAVRTAAVSGAATRRLAREDACELALVGSGVQARTHLAAMASVRDIRRARVVSLHVEHAPNSARCSWALTPAGLRPTRLRSSSRSASPSKTWLRLNTFTDRRN